MYRSQTKRKSDQHRAVPYDITSSSGSKRKSSSGFVSPIVNLEETLAAQKKSDSTLLNDSLTELNNLKKQEKTEFNEQQQVKEKVDQQQSVKESITDKKVNKHDELIDKMENKIESNIKTTNNSTKQDDVAYEDQFDSEFDRLFESSSLATKLNEDTNFTRTECQLNSQLSDQSNDELIDKNDLIKFNEMDSQEVRSRILNTDDELFDSDAINNEESDSDQSLNDDDNVKPCDKNNDNLDKSLEEELDDCDVFNDFEIDSTLIFRSDNPDQKELITQPIHDIGPEEVDFKTASGDLIKISEQKFKAAARRLGIEN